MFKWGRINRTTYFLGLGAVVILYGLMATFLAKPPGMGEILAASLAIPRLHDIGKSAWWFSAGIVGELAVVGLGIAMATHGGTEDAILIAAGLYVIFALGLMIWLGCIPGNPESNKYGEVPANGISYAGAAKPSA